MHDMNASSASERYDFIMSFVSGALQMQLTKSGTSVGQDITAVVLAGDLYDFSVAWIADS